MRTFLIVILVQLFIYSCSTPRPEGNTEAEILYKEAEELIEDGRYILATEKLNRIRSKFPYSYYATFAELLSADVLFKQENYAEAAASYIVFKDFHPKHKKSDYVLFKIAESYFNQLPSTHDRDLAPAFEAIKYYQELLGTYPKSEYSKSGNENIEKCKQMIRDKEQYIADFYFKTNVFDAARYRYETIIENFKEPKLISHAMIRSIEASKKLGDKKYCENKKVMFESIISDEFQKKLKRAFERCLES